MLLSLLLATAVGLPARTLVDGYIERMFQTFPSRATEAGRHDLDTRLEDLSAERRAGWLEFNRTSEAAMKKALAEDGLSLDDRLDLEVALAHAAREIHGLEARHRPERDPLFWTHVLGNATVHLLLRDDLPLRARLESALERARQIPRLAAQAREALAKTPQNLIAPELCRLAAPQARATAAFYRDGFAKAASGPAAGLTGPMTEVGAAAATSLDAFAVFLDDLAARASGSPRLGPAYAATFRLGTGVTEDVAKVRERAERDLRAKRAEAAAFGRSVFADLLPGEAVPAGDGALLKRLFARVAEDRARSVEEIDKDFRSLAAGVEAYVRKLGIVTLPDPLTLFISRSPSYFLGQSVGGVYPAGPYAPGADTLYFFPTPSDTATPAQKEGFYRDFNHHFNVMITPHELIPGHYLQLKYAARNPRKARTVFADGVTVEGWGTFCERLLLDEGWGGPLDRLAHLKKQMENIARAIVDIKVHTEGITRDEVLRFVKEDALQDEQFASNMWTRAITSAPQITTYYLGYSQVRTLYDDVKKARGSSFRLREFMDGMMELGPVPVARYRERMLGTR
jgi:uncharacterized protein (DUF885 family)